MNIGELVNLRTYGDGKVTLRLIKRQKDTLIVCDPKEYEIAKSKGREPKTVGFNVKYLISN